MQRFLSFLNGMESATISYGNVDKICFSNQPVGTILAEILNADILEIKRRIDSCKKAPSRNPLIVDSMSTVSLMASKAVSMALGEAIEEDHALQDFYFCDYAKFAVEIETLKKDYPIMFSILCEDLWEAWKDITFEFCQTDCDGGNRLLNEISAFKSFLEEIMETPEFFSFDFLEYLNTAGGIRPFSVLPCSVFSEHHKRAENLSEDIPLKVFYSMFINSDSSTSKEYRYEMLDSFSITYIMICSFLETARAGKVVRKCKNCGKYFVPSKRSDTLYCDNPSPADPGMTCKQYGTNRLWYEKQRADELATLSRNIASAKGMLAKRNPDIPGYEAAYTYFKEQRLIWMKEVKIGNKTPEEYREWLLKMKNQKTL